MNHKARACLNVSALVVATIGFNLLIADGADTKPSEEALPLPIVLAVNVALLALVGWSRWFFYLLMFAFCSAQPTLIERAWGDAPEQLLWRIPLFAGGCLNAIAIAANDWRMPVLSKPARYVSGIHKGWSPLVVLPSLCDVHASGTTSVGDFVVLFGFVALGALQLYGLVQP